MAIPARGRTSVLPRVAVENSERLSVWGEAGYGAGEPTLTPAARGGVTIRLPATAHCAAEGAVCTNGGREVSEALSVTVFRTGLTARFEKVPEEHDGSAFTFDFRFSEAPQGAQLQDDAWLVLPRHERHHREGESPRADTVPRGPPTGTFVPHDVNASQGDTKLRAGGAARGAR